MSPLAERLGSILNHLKAGSGTDDFEHKHNLHTLSPTFFLPRAAAIEPDAEAIVHLTRDNKVLRRSYQVFADRACGLAHFLLKHNLKRVGVLAPNTPAFLECIYGVVAAGGVVVPVNYRLKEDDIAYIFDFAEVDAIVVDDEYKDLLGAYIKAHPKTRIVVDLDTATAEAGQCGPYGEAVLEGMEFDAKNSNEGWAGLEAQCKDEEDMIALPFTSGTTSRPKGVMLSHRGAYLAAMGGIVDNGLNVQDRRCKYLWILPMFHAMGWTFPWSVTAVRGTHYGLRKIDYPLIWKILKEEGITHFCAAPTVNTLLCNSPEAERLPRPIRVVVAASPPTAHLFQLMTSLNLLPRHAYGMTETYGPLTCCYELPSWDELPEKERFARMARQGHGFVTSLPIRVVKTDQPEGVLIDVAKNGEEIGEIVFFGNICAKGYYKDPAATRKLFAGGGLHSGDLAVWHPDGSAQVLDRSKDIIISGGENISSVALESMLVEHPSILEAGVVAVPDEHWGERPKAYITLKQGRHVDETEFLEWARNHNGISKFMVPREVEIVPELPKTSTGKIRKNVLREWAKTGVNEEK
ncbi:Acetate/butyrate--CoA ligase AAE7, peroxisomal [Ceratocystis lukuohia]|uniref:Acetate/butyrate--CoA ligase AAE7, peroxisomal n=1 Tax=Ceratocystis lukuohia TaxID=2019550 RepID=A0ABR4MG06_9PEZI